MTLKEKIEKVKMNKARLELLDAVKERYGSCQTAAEFLKSVEVYVVALQHNEEIVESK
jgi:hypothetical protein